MRGRGKTQVQSPQKEVYNQIISSGPNMEGKKQTSFRQNAKFQEYRLVRYGRQTENTRELEHQGNKDREQGQSLNTQITRRRRNQSGNHKGERTHRGGTNQTEQHTSFKSRQDLLKKIQILT